MSDNKLLAENTIRRFMKLANVNSLTDTFINEKYGKPGKEEDKMQEESVEETEETIEEQEEEETIEEQMDDEAPEEDMESDEMEVDMADLDADPAGDEPEMGAADISLTEEEAELLIDLGERLKEAMGGDDADAGMDDMGAAEDIAPDDDMGEMEDEDEPGMRDVYENQDEIVQEVLKRVTKRIVAEKLKSSK